MNQSELDKCKSSWEQATDHAVLQAALNRSSEHAIESLAMARAEAIRRKLITPDGKVIPPGLPYNSISDSLSVENKISMQAKMATTNGYLLDQFKKANLSIKAAWIAGIVSGTVTLIASFTGLYGLNLLALTDVALISGLSFGIFKKSRTCAIIMLVYFILCKIMLLKRNGIPQPMALCVAIAFTIIYFMGITGTLAYHKLLRMSLNCPEASADNYETITCENCDLLVDKLDYVYKWAGHIVCRKCYIDFLRKHTTSSPVLLQKNYKASNLMINRAAGQK